MPVVDLPELPPIRGPPSLAGGHPVAEYVSLEAGETVVGLGSLEPDGPGLALGTAQGVVKRVVPDYPANRDEFEVIGLKEGDSVVGAVELPSERPRPGLHHLQRPAAALPRLPGPPAGPPGRRHGGHPARPRARR